MAVIGAVLVSLWAASGAVFFWPAGPLFWLLLSLGVHVRRTLGSVRVPPRH